MAEEGKTKAEQNAALSDLSTEGKADASTSGTSRAEDQSALHAAISNLSLQEKLKAGDKSTPTKSEATDSAAKEDGKKVVKIAEDDIKKLMDMLEVSRRKAEDLLRRNDGKRDAAIRDFVLPRPITS